MPGMITETIRYSDIFDATEVKLDEFHDEAPWESCDGFEHATDGADDLSRSERREMRGYVPHSDYLGRSDFAVTVSAKQVKAWGVAQFARSRGASKQVAAELAAHNLGTTIDQLAAWYRSGWEWYGVTCDFHGVHDSLWGIDSEKYAEEVRGEIAYSVAYQLRKQGCYIVGVPGRQHPTRADKLARLRYNLNSQNWGR